ncbi:low affinity immunoglobulin gamma Fc region receptor II-a-like [Anabas testudineus]|uniref:Ig-like domain-containing protein n=1 Tax=Anabas testudineus TaxID=64144 RepID=A0AAQ6IMR0_ANATE|nr:low affinity immunoglobulin gamma Fc region receptor II-a-like [Anabas testudineus]
MKPPFVFLLCDWFMLLLSGLTVPAISLNVSPNRQQFFTGESVSIGCGEAQNPAGWKLKRISLVNTEMCGSFGNLHGSSCTISYLSPLADEGVYWCEHANGKRSIKVTITVSARPFIMEIPALPVLTGSSVTLRCRNRNGFLTPSHFFKFGRHRSPITTAPTGEFTISNIQQSDEGFYWCSNNSTDSPSSRLNVKDSSSLASASPMFRLICHLVVISPYCASTGLMVSIYCCRKKGKTPPVTVEMGQDAESDQGWRSENVNADVTTEHDF